MISPRFLLGMAFLALTLGLVARWPGHGALKAAEVAAQEGAWEEAAQALDALGTPTVARWSSEAIFHRGVVAWEQGETEAALAAWRAAADATPRSRAYLRPLQQARRAFDSRPPPVERSASWTRVLTPGEAGGLLTLLWLGVSWTARQARHGRASPVTAWSLGAAALLLSVAVWSGHRESQRPVLVSLPDTAARPLPDPVVTPSHRWPAGTELLWRGERGDFVRVIDASGTTGWVLRHAVAWPPDARPPAR